MIIINLFLILLLSLRLLLSASIRSKPNLLSKRWKYSLKSSAYKNNRLKITPTSQDDYPDQLDLFTDKSRFANDDNVQQPLQTVFASCKLNEIPDHVLEFIFEYLLPEYASVRETCSTFCLLFDSMSYRMTWTNFPYCNKDTFAQWKDVDEFKMIRLAQLGSLFTDPRITYKFIPNPGLSLKELAIYWVYVLKALDEEPASLITISIFIKLEIIAIAEVLPRSRLNAEKLNRIWTLGLLSLASAVAHEYFILFRVSIGPVKEGLLLAVTSRKHAVAKLMIDNLGTITLYPMSILVGYFSKIVCELIEAEYWDLLYMLNLMHSNYIRLDYRPHLNYLAEIGSVPGLTALANQAARHPENLAHIAASFGHVAFLEKLHSLGLLVKYAGLNHAGDTAIHCAAFSGSIDCLLYLLDILPGDPLNALDANGLMPIHTAAQTGRTGTMLEIIARNPRYHPRGIRSWFKGINSPLHIAVCCAQLEAARILIIAFPELIGHKDEGETVIHLTVTNADDDMLELLLQAAPMKAIKDVNAEGNTVLHIAARHGLVSKMKLLLATGHFHGTERNKRGETPISILKQRHPNVNVPELFAGIERDILLNPNYKSIRK